MKAICGGSLRRGELFRGDGVLINNDDWWISVRPSNTEPLLRLNVEARDGAEMASLRDEVLGLIGEQDRDAQLA